jgi:hypothetical protein
LSPAGAPDVFREIPALKQRERQIPHLMECANAVGSKFSQDASPCRSNIAGAQNQLSRSDTSSLGKPNPHNSSKKEEFA